MMDRTLLKNIFDVVCKHFKECACRGCPILSLSIEVKRAQCEDIMLDYPAEIERLLVLWMDMQSGLLNKQKNAEEREPETRRGILQAAERCVCGDRDNQYGRPENSFRVIAAFWTQYIMSKCVPKKTTVDIGPDDVAAMMVLFKMARVATGQNKADNWIDGAGYCACGGEIAGKVRE